MNATLVRLRVSPGAVRSGIVGRHGDGWKVRVSAAPERGRANDVVLAVLADSLALSRADVRLVSGARDKDKIVEVDGMDRAKVDARLASAADRKRRT